tara:strand:- start:490 stop:1263 length:774 start_codon:yes stop_codon:yes gene_type:complete
MKIIVVSGGFDPVHSGHIAYFKSAKLLGDRLIVALNSDNWLKNKKNKFFMPFNERKIIIENLSMVDDVIDFMDDEYGSAKNALKKIKKMYPNDDIVFCNGGDRDENNIPEMEVKDIDFKFGIGGSNKINSSSWILKDYQFDQEERIWGKFYNLYQDNFLKVKELIIAPGKGMSLQRHKHRNEIWFVSKGKCETMYHKTDSDKIKSVKLGFHESFHVPKMAWHQLINTYEEPCHIIEIQYGHETSEEDIERLSYYEKN